MPAEHSTTRDAAEDPTSGAEHEGANPGAKSPAATDVDSFVRRALGLRFEMRFVWETKWWPADSRDVAETLAGYYYDYGLHSCLEMMRDGKELPTALALFRLRRF